MQPCIKYVGSKRKLLEVIGDYLHPNTTGIIEPFCGSAALSFEWGLPFYISDASPELMNFYEVLAGDKYPELITELARIAGNQGREQYLSLRAEDRDPSFYDDANSVRRAGRYYAIIYGGYNGLYRVNGSGFCNTPIGDKWVVPDYPRLAECREYMHKFCMGHSFQQFDSPIVFAATLQSGDHPFVLIDPPYSDGDGGKKVFKEYTPEKDRGDFYPRLLAYLQLLDSHGISFLMTNTYCDFILEMFGEFTIDKVPVKYTIAADGSKRGTKFEAFVSN